MCRSAGRSYTPPRPHRRSGRAQVARTRQATRANNTENTSALCDTLEGMMTGTGTVGTRPRSPMRAGIALLAALAVLTSPAAAAGVAPPESADNFTVHWTVTTDPVYLRRNKDDLAANIDFAGAPIVRDATVLYQHRIGLYPKGGPHIPLLDPTYMDRHKAKLAADLDKLIPDKNYSGLAVIDYEAWHLIWEWTQNVPSGLGLTADDKDYRDDWAQYVQQR